MAYDAEIVSLRKWMEKPFRDEPLSSERLDERALALAAHFTIDPHRRHARSIYPRLRDNARVLEAAYRTLLEGIGTSYEEVREIGGEDG